MAPAPRGRSVVSRRWNGLSTTSFPSGIPRKPKLQVSPHPSLHKPHPANANRYFQKLDPFFPPTEQVQSLNLRAALLRSLEAVKKNGFLGRDAVVRKTMLDECRGERLEEVLATFSFAVVRKVVTERTEEGGKYPALAQSLAMENRGYTGDRTELAVLKLAHQAALSKALREKSDARALYGDFADLLGLKKRSIARRREQVKAVKDKGEAKAVTEDEKLEVWRLVRNNWAGNEKWMETLLHGDSNTRRDGLLSTPFDKVWRRVQAGRLSELDDRGSGLMEQLDSRVRMQRERLQKWEGFRKTMLGDGPVKKETGAAEKSKAKVGLGLRFTDHLNLHMGEGSPRKAESEAAEPTKLTPKHAELIASFERDLKESKEQKAKPITIPIPQRSAHPDPRGSADSFATSAGTISELEDLYEEIPPMETAPVITRLPQRRPNHRPTRSRKLGSDDLSRVDFARDPELENLRARKISRPPPAATPEINVSPPASPARPSRPYLPERSPTKELIAKQSLQIGPSSSVMSFFPSDAEHSQDDTPKSPTQQEADDILASMSNASPSPTKPKPRHTLSITERTRLSMARSSRANLLDDEEDSLPSLPHRPAPAPEPTEETDLEYDDIVARTQRSMAGYEAARQKAQLERRRSARKSQREGSQFHKAAEQQFRRVSEEDDHDASALAEELMGAAEQSYENVFMSRPKIKASPVPSPTRGLEDD